MSKLVVYNVYSMSHFKAKINMMLTHADGPSEKKLYHATHTRLGLCL